MIELPIERRAIRHRRGLSSPLLALFLRSFLLRALLLWHIARDRA